MLQPGAQARVDAGVFVLLGFGRSRRQPARPSFPRAKRLSQSAEPPSAGVQPVYVVTLWVRKVALALHGP